MPINNNILNQKGTPAFYSDIFANRPAFGYAGRVFISTDTGAIYEDTGTSWTLIADAGAGTTGTLQQVTTNGNTTTLGIQVQGININDGAGTGLFNTAVGTSALLSNTTGASNTSIGNNTLSANTTGVNNNSLGYNSLKFNTTGGNNVALGTNALQNNTTASDNTAVGNNSLNGNTTGFYNTAIGSSSLIANTTGNYNTAIGYYSLSANTTANYNTAIGNNSLQQNTTGNSNTSIGYGSLVVNSTGNTNTAVGMNTLGANTTASNNTAIGFQSLLLNTTGGNNTGIGSGSLSLNTTGIQNTAIGSSSLGANITGSYNASFGVGSLANNLGSYNVGFGHSSLNAVTTGTNNTAIGYSSGSAITTGSNNTIIGAYGGTTTLANNIVLSDGAGNVRLFSDANGLIGINQSVGSVPGGQLDIHTTQTYALVLNGLTTNNAYTAFSNNSVGKWRIGNTYNAGANTFDIFNLGTSSNAITILSTNNNVGIGINTPQEKFEISGLNGNVRIYGRSGISNNTISANIYYNGSSWVRDNSSYGAADISFSSANDTIIFSNTASTTGPTSEKLRIDSSGNVGINTTTPDFPLTIKTDASANSLKILGRTSSNDTSISWNSSNNATQYAHIDIGTSYFQIFASNSQSIQFYTGGSETMRITSSKNVQINTTTNGVNGYLQFSGAGGSSNIYNYNNILSINDQILIANSGGAVTIGNLAGTGSRAVLADANGVLSAPVSDISVKENINTIGYGLNEILKMNPVWFNYNDEYKSFGKGRQNGNIAQEMETIIPEAVFTTPSTGKMGINYDQLHAVYIKAIQELKAEIDALKNN